MSVGSGLSGALRPVVSGLEADLRARVALPGVDVAWRARHGEAVSAGRTAASFVEWRDERVTQAAVAWVLVSVFVRFCEDNALVGPVWISGPGGRRQEALDGQAAFFRSRPDDTDREWLEQAVDYLTKLPATAGLVDEHSALWLVAPSGDAVSELLGFWRQTDEHGAPVWDLFDPQWDTRFLGDLYQDLSEAARSRYALLQTPVFVEEFILDRTLEPALAERRLDGFRLIDPTCGSGHFLLGAFARLLDRWHREAPGMDARERVQFALDAIHGVDVNPYAVAIARFRLTVAALRASGLSRLEEAPAFRYHLAVGDSLLHGSAQQALDVGLDLDTDVVLSGFGYATEDLAALREILQPGRYDCVVGNPPYITVKDTALNQAYRDRYTTCHRQYALTVPFMERFFQLAKTGDRAGWVGQITSNSFMKREFGTKLIEQFLNTRDLRLVIDSEGAWIPGHNSDGTPTVILVGRNRSPMSATVRSVLSNGLRETREHADGSGPYWRAIVDHVDDPGYEDTWVTVTDMKRSHLAGHPWSLSGGGVVELVEQIERAAAMRLGNVADIGFGTITGEDAAYAFDSASAWRLKIEERRPLIVGDGVRDYVIAEGEVVAFPYRTDLTLRPIEELPETHRILWPNRRLLQVRKLFGTPVEKIQNFSWYEHREFYRSRYRTPLSIVYAEIAPDCHFVLDRGGSVFNRTAPVVKLPEEATESEQLAILGLLNCSTACLWLRDRTKPKGGAAGQSWARTHQFNVTTLKDFPLPSSYPGRTVSEIVRLSERLKSETPTSVCASGAPSRRWLDVARMQQAATRALMVAMQEELDWECYRLYDLVDEDLSYHGDDLPGLALGERAFEIVLARKIADGSEQSAWFERHGSTPITEIPARWPVGYRELVGRRIELIESHPYLRLLERSEHKRRWAAEAWEKQEERALRGWLLDRLEDRRFWFDAPGRPQARSIAQLADEVARDPDLVSVLGLWEGRPDVSVTQSLVRLLDGEAVPFLAAYRYKESGLRKRAAWEDTWVLQRREDAGENVGVIPVPPKYVTGDFAKPAYASRRGELDVPKERFILYPAAGRDTDPTVVLGWAGWDHAEQALALARLVQDREADGWAEQRLVPLLAGLAELQPWLEQWHAHPQPPLFAATAPADYFREQLTRRAQQAGHTLDQLTAWRPPATTRKRQRKSA